MPAWAPVHGSNVEPHRNRRRDSAFNQLFTFRSLVVNSPLGLIATALLSVLCHSLPATLSATLSATISSPRLIVFVSPSALRRALHCLCKVTRQQLPVCQLAGVTNLLVPSLSMHASEHVRLIHAALIGTHVSTHYFRLPPLFSGSIPLELPYRLIVSVQCKALAFPIHSKPHIMSQSSVCAKN